MASTLVIQNPAAGRGRVRKYWPRVEEALRGAGIEFDLVRTQAPRQATEIAAQAAQNYSTVVGVGGDGTVHEIVNGLMQASGEAETITMGVVPLGTGDDFAKMIPPEAPVGGKPFSWRSAVDKIKRGETKLLDVGRFSVESAVPGTELDLRYFANSTDVGFGAQGAINHGSMPKFLKGFSAYIATALRTLINYPTLPVRIQLDDEPSFEQLTAMTVVMNGRSFGNGFWVCPQASAEDGLFDLMVAEDVNRLTILRLLPKIMKGTHLNEPVLRMYRAQRVVIESSQPLAVESDGEIPYLNAKRLDMEVLHKRLRVLV